MSTRYTCPRCHYVTLAGRHLNRVTCAACGCVITHEYVLARAAEAMKVYFRKQLELADTQELPSYQPETSMTLDKTKN